MEYLYVTREGSSFIGGADNLSKFIGDKLDERYEVAFNRITWKELFETDLSDCKRLFLESSVIEDYDSLRDLPERVLTRTYIFMHSTPYACENELADGVLGVSVYDVIDNYKVRDLAKKGVAFYFANQNFVRIAMVLYSTDKVYYFDISEYKSPNYNFNDKLNPRRNNKVLFLSGYYHPAVGAQVLYEMIKLDTSRDFEWIISERALHESYYRLDGKYWKELFMELLPIRNIKFIPFTRDLGKIYEDVRYNLVISAGDSYSFKALEALSHGCINVTTFDNVVNPWFKYSLSCWCDASQDIKDIARGMFNTLMNDYMDFKLFHSDEMLLERGIVQADLKDILRSYEDELPLGDLWNYLSLFYDILINNIRGAITSPEISKNYWKFNRYE